MLRDKEGIYTFCRRRHGQGGGHEKRDCIEIKLTPDGGFALEIDHHTLQSLRGYSEMLIQCQMLKDTSAEEAISPLKDLKSANPSVKAKNVFFKGIDSWYF